MAPSERRDAGSHAGILHERAGRRARWPAPTRARIRRAWAPLAGACAPHPPRPRAGVKPARERVVDTVPHAHARSATYTHPVSGGAARWRTRMSKGHLLTVLTRHVVSCEVQRAPGRPQKRRRWSRVRRKPRYARFAQDGFLGRSSRSSNDASGPFWVRGPRHQPIF